MNPFNKKKARKMSLGVTSLSQVGDRLKALDFVLGLFKMRVGAESVEVDATNGRLTCVYLTVYLMK